MDNRKADDGNAQSSEANAPEAPAHAEISFAESTPTPTPISSAEISLPDTESPRADVHAEVSYAAEEDADTASLPSKAQSPYRTGSTLLNRFRILRYLARGGMGEVYEVEDEITGRTMALKTVLPAVARNRQMIEQLKQEVNNARDVTHRNVCRVFELFEDPSTAPPAYFLTMEFLQGETLADVLHRDGPISTERLMPILKQMTAGLEAVHQAGIVHQDFKTSNVMLVESANDKRVVVTDFGLAVDLRAKRHAGTMSGGTPAYMAPEQVEAKLPVDKRADIYAFGVVLYEMLTGRFPIEGKTAREVMQRKLHEPAVPPSRHNPKIPPHWERAILRCLERDPALRFNNVTDVLAAIEQRAEKRRRRIVAFGSAAVLLVAIAGLSGAVVRRYMVTHRVPTIAIAGIANGSSPNNDWLATEIADSLSMNLSHSKDLKTVPQDDVALIRGEFPQVTGSSIERENLSGFREALGADYLVIGHYEVRGDAEPKLVFELKLQGSDGEVVGQTIREEGPERDYQRLVTSAANQLRSYLGSTLLSEAEAEETANVYPKNANVRHLYFEALSQTRSLNGVTALDLLRKASTLEEENVAIHAAETEALVLQKRFGEARLEARRARELAQAAQIPSDYAMLVEARADELSNDWPSAIQRLDPLYRLSRDKLRYGLLLANAQVHAMRSPDALRTLGELAKLPNPAGNDPRISIAQGEAFSISGDYQEEVQAATRALSSARSRKWRLMEAWADLQLCWAQQRLQSGASLTPCQEGQQIFATAGDPVNAAVVLNNIANWQITRGNLTQAREAYETVLEITTKADDKVDSAGAHLNLAATLLQLNDLPAAREHLNAALQLCATTNDKYDEARARLILADLNRATVGVNEAISEVQRSQEIARDIGDRDTEGYAWTNLILYRKDAGDLAGALLAGKQAIAIRKELDDRAGIATAQEFLADVYYEEGDLTRASELYAEAMAGLDASETPRLAQLWVSLAQVDLDSGNLNRAAENARKAANEYHAERDGDSEADALAVLARIKLAQKELKETSALLKQIDALNPQDQEVQANVAVARAMWLTASGRPTEAIELLRDSAANKRDLTYSALSARLTLARAYQAAKQEAIAVAEFASIRKDAQKAGFQLLVQQARQPH